MAGGIEVTINEVPNVVNAITGTTINSLAASMRDEVEKEVEKVRLKVFSLLASKIIGKTRTPNFGIDTPPKWERLSPATIARKKHNRFYEQTGNLGLKLRVRTSRYTIDSNLGASSVTISQKGARILPSTRTRSGYSVRSTKDMEVDITGGGEAYNLRTGRLIKAFGAIQAELTVKPFEHIADITDNYLAVNEIFGPGGPAENVSVFDGRRMVPMAFKLTNVRGGQHRAVLGWYFNWYVRTQVTKAVEKGLQKARRRFDRREARRIAAKLPVSSMR